MCQRVSEIKFCTCKQIDNEIINEYYWILNRFVGIKNDKRLGKIAIPTNNLGNGITTEKIIETLNKINCFDFDYIPKDNDTIQISVLKMDIKREYFSLIYRNKNWEIGNNPAFKSIKEEIGRGKLKI